MNHNLNRNIRECIRLKRIELWALKNTWVFNTWYMPHADTLALFVVYSRREDSRYLAEELGYIPHYLNKPNLSRLMEYHEATYESQD